MGFFLGKKLWHRRRFKSARYGWPYYPQDIKKLVEKHHNATFSQGWQIPATGETRSSGDSSAKFSPEEIQLAGTTLKIVNGEIPFHTSFDDPEDSESLHRWNWLLTLFSATPSSQHQELALWTHRQIQIWTRLFGHEIDEAHCHKCSRWESYTVGERISNTILFHQWLDLKPSSNTLTLIEKFSRFLLTRMEFKGDFTGNHVFNNARAL